jgi:hypothetical protein
MVASCATMAARNPPLKTHQSKQGVVAKEKLSIQY